MSFIKPRSTETTRDRLLTAAEMEIPRACSSGMKSMVAVPSPTSPM